MSRLLKFFSVTQLTIQTKGRLYWNYHSPKMKFGPQQLSAKDCDLCTCMKLLNSCIAICHRIIAAFVFS